MPANHSVIKVISSNVIPGCDVARANGELLVADH